MRRRPRETELFSLSFLDIITCGFGAMILILLITKPGVVESENTAEVGALLNQSFESEDLIGRLSARLEQLKRELDEWRGQNKDALLTEQTRDEELRRKETRSANLENELSGLASAKQSLERAAASRDTATERDVEVGGIPVDSDYVIFIIDTSGSMQGIWERVMREIGNILDIHPQVKGFQILSDMGRYLVQGYRGKWIPDTPARRKSIIKLLRTWATLSNSSPVEGLEVALKTYAKSGRTTSIYIFGDEYTGDSYDEVIKTVDRLNISKKTGKPLVKVHAVGFINPEGIVHPKYLETNKRFSTLMREVTKRNGGTFIALPAE